MNEADTRAELIAPESGVEELSQDKLPILLELKYNSFSEAQRVLGEVKNISAMFVDFQQYLYQEMR